MAIGIFVSLLVSILLYFLYENRYRFWDWKWIAVVSTALLLLNVALLLNLSCRKVPFLNPFFS